MFKSATVLMRGAMTSIATEPKKNTVFDIVTLVRVDDAYGKRSW